MDLITYIVHVADSKTVLLFFIILILWKWLLPMKKSRLPPGPRPWPIFGNMPHLAANREVYKTFQKWFRQYGSIVTIWLGNNRAVVLNDFDVIKEAMIKKGDVFLSRPNFQFLLTMTEGKGVIFQQNLSHWREVRRFTIMALRDFGVGKSSLEELVNDELKAFKVELDRINHGPLSLKDLLTNAISNIINSIVYGSRFDYNDKEFQSVQEDFDFLFSKGGLQVPDNVLPWLQKIPFRHSIISDLKRIRQRLKHFTKKRIDEHEKTFDTNNIRDFLDLYIEANRKGTYDSEALTEKNIMQVILDLYVAGTETTNTTILWAFLYMILHPHIQAKCRQTIIEVIGTSRLPRLSDRVELPYIEATLLEIQRLANTAPLSIAHRASEDVQVGGYLIPKDTVAFVNMYAVHMNPRIYPDPRAFQPERWLDDTGKVIRREEFIPFSAGRRACLGESLAKMELFLFFTNLLQRYEFKMVDPSQPPSSEGYQGMTRTPHPYQLLVKKDTQF